MTPIDETQRIQELSHQELLTEYISYCMAPPLLTIGTHQSPLLKEIYRRMGHLPGTRYVFEGTEDPHALAESKKFIADMNHEDLLDKYHEIRSTRGRMPGAQYRGAISLVKDELFHRMTPKPEEESSAKNVTVEEFMSSKRPQKKPIEQLSLVELFNFQSELNAQTNQVKDAVLKKLVDA